MAELNEQDEAILAELHHGADRLREEAEANKDDQLAVSDKPITKGEFALIEQRRSQDDLQRLINVIAVHGGIVLADDPEEDEDDDEDDEAVADDRSAKDLGAEASELNIAGRSKMSKAELAEAVDAANAKDDEDEDGA